MSYDPAEYGQAVKGQYDDLYPEYGLATAATCEMLARLAGESGTPRFLEFGIGTGRLALGVQAQGIHVAGIDGSPEMLKQLRAKPAGKHVDVVCGDYRTARVNAKCGVVALVFNGIFDPRGTEAQLDIFKNALDHLVPGGYFVVESWVMNERQKSGEWEILPRFVGNQHVELQMARYDLDTNSIERTLVHLREGTTNFVAVRDTYAAPQELDLMAHVTGFSRVSRHAGWKSEPFNIASANHVTVYRKR